MTGFDLFSMLYLLVATIVGGCVGWLLQSRNNSQNIDQMGEEWQSRLGAIVRQKDQLSSENASLIASLQAEQALVQKHHHAAASTRTELESLREQANTFKKNAFMIGAERDDLKGKVSAYHNALATAKHQIAELKSEFAKTQAYFKSQLETTIEQRNTLERKVDDARREHESLSNLLISAKSEHESVSNLLMTAQTRLENLDALEQKVIALEADNAQLKHESTLAKKEAESLQRDVAETKALKEQNRELVHCLESMETSRKQHEEDSRRYRDQYEQSEKDSETLRFKIGDIEKNWAEMQRARSKKKKNGAKPKTGPSPFGLEAPDGEPDDLTEIVGIGKVFQHTLHELGVFHFRQIAAFGPAEIARINAELKEFKGRIEHDDWIGQAKELHFKKYGNANGHDAKAKNN